MLGDFHKTHRTLNATFFIGIYLASALKNRHTAQHCYQFDLILPLSYPKRILTCDFIEAIGNG